MLPAVETAAFHCINNSVPGCAIPYSTPQQGLDCNQFRRVPSFTSPRFFPSCRILGRCGSGLNLTIGGDRCPHVPRFDHLHRWGSHHALSWSLFGPVSRSRTPGRAAPDRSIIARSGVRYDCGLPEHSKQPLSIAAQPRYCLFWQTLGPASASGRD